MNPCLRAATLAALVIVAACASDKSKTDQSSGSAESGVGNPTQTNSASDSIVGTPTQNASNAGAAGLPSGNVLYFDFDSSALSQADQQLVEAWGAYLSANAGAKVRLEGHTDERGTREYNVALGERRANAVLQALTARGVSANQLSVASFGEERPVAVGHDEAAWAQNRRVEIVK